MKEYISFIDFIEFTDMSDEEKYKLLNSKNYEIERLNNIINELENKLLELRLTDVDGKTIVYRLLDKLQELKV